MKGHGEKFCSGRMLSSDRAISCCKTTRLKRKGQEASPCTTQHRSIFFTPMAIDERDFGRQGIEISCQRVFVRSWPFASLEGVSPLSKSNFVCEMQRRSGW